MYETLYREYRQANSFCENLQFGASFVWQVNCFSMVEGSVGYHSVNSSSHSVNGDIAIQWE